MVLCDWRALKPLSFPFRIGPATAGVPEPQVLSMRGIVSGARFLMLRIPDNLCQVSGASSLRSYSTEFDRVSHLRRSASLRGQRRLRLLSWGLACPPQPASERLVNGEDWVRFGGAGNIDDNVLNLPDGAYRAVSLRAFDKACGLWSIWRLGGRPPRRLDPPVVGRSGSGAGTSFADDSLNG